MKDDVEAEEEEEHEEKLLAAKLRRGYERQKQGTRTLAYILIAVILCVVILGASAYASNYLVKWALDFTGVAATEFLTRYFALTPDLFDKDDHIMISSVHGKYGTGIAENMEKAAAMLLQNRFMICHSPFSFRITGNPQITSTTWSARFASFRFSLPSCSIYKSVCSE